MDASLPASEAIAPAITIGANFEGSDLSASGGSIPPDTNGAIGPGHFVELLNGIYRVYDKSGDVLQQQTLPDFWSSAGVTPASPFDPRVVYDPQDQRWFATSADNQAPPSRILLAISNTADPTEGWQAVAIPGDTERWFDFPTLGLNEQGIFLASRYIDNTPDDPPKPNIALVALPKSDLLAAKPTSDGATFLDVVSSATGSTVQPAVAPQSSGPEPLLSMFGSPEPPGFSTVLKDSLLVGPVTGPTLDTDGRIISVPPFQNPSRAAQDGTTIAISTGDAGFSSSVVMQGDRLFAVHTSESEDGGPELRWVVIGDPTGSPVLLDTGSIHPAGLDAYFGSIAVNPLGQAVIGFTGSGPGVFPSAYAVAGTLDGDDLEFGDPILLKAGVAAYLPGDGRSGDYSATTYDPADATHFWTIQEWASGEFAWSTQIAEIIFGAEPEPPSPPFDWEALATRVFAYFERTGQWGLIDEWLSDTPPDQALAESTVDWDALGSRVTAYFDATGQWGLLDDWLAGNPPDNGPTDYLLLG